MIFPSLRSARLRAGWTALCCALLAFAACDDGTMSATSGGGRAPGAPLLDLGTGGGDTPGGGVGGGAVDPGSVTIPPEEYCAPAASWAGTDTELELEVVRIVNERRAVGGNCPDGSSHGPSSPLAVNGVLTCAARIHTLDMNARSYFSHVSPEGGSPGDRLAQAGYAGGGWGENIARGYPTAEAVVDGWMSSTTGHCANILNAGFRSIGVGHQDTTWTQVFGR
ncbi:MAG: CAP domain-containing protein [Myxococcota bacterium]